MRYGIGGVESGEDRLGAETAMAQKCDAFV